MVLLETREPRAPKEWYSVRIGLAAIGTVMLVLILRSTFGALSGDSYAFLNMQGDDPVTWNHCQAIRYQVNPRGAPEDWQKIVDSAVDDIEKASGFVFAYKGTSPKSHLIGTGQYAGNEWEPVLIVWSDRYQSQSLDGAVVGRGGGRSIDVNGVQRYVIGQVTLDSSVHDSFETQMVLEHELGHVLGLDHTDDSSQLMFEGYHGQQGLGKGDIAGLKRLHDVPCDQPAVAPVPSSG